MVQFLEKSILPGPKEEIERGKGVSVCVCVCVCVCVWRGSNTGFCLLAMLIWEVALYMWLELFLPEDNCAVEQTSPRNYSTYFAMFI